MQFTAVQCSAVQYSVDICPQWLTSGRCCWAADSDSGSSPADKLPFQPQPQQHWRRPSQGPCFHTGNLSANRPSLRSRDRVDDDWERWLAHKEEEPEPCSLTNGLFESKDDWVSSFGEFVNPVPDPLKSWECFLFNTETMLGILSPLSLLFRPGVGGKMFTSLLIMYIVHMSHRGNDTTVQSEVSADNNTTQLSS